MSIHHAWRVLLLTLLVGVTFIPASIQAFASTPYKGVAVSGKSPRQQAVCGNANTLFLPVSMARTEEAPPPPEGPPTQDAESASLGQLTVEGVMPETFNSRIGSMTIAVDCVTFTPESERIHLLLNQQAVPSDTLTITTDTITIQGAWVDGWNDVQLYAEDSRGASLGTAMGFWAGNESLTVTVQDEAGVPVAGVTVTTSLGDDQTIQSVGTTSGAGTVTFQNLPDRTIMLEARTATNDFATLAVTGSSGAATLTLLGFNPPSSVDNNDFSQGLEGWEIGTAPVTLIPHVEEGMEAHAADAQNLDLQLGTSGEGAQRISRTFETTPGTENVVVRYRFQTEEVPGGYYGQEWNDYFSVSVRAQNSGASAEANSMNGLGLGAFDGAGATAWREEILPVDKEGDVVQVDITVANVGDELFDSQVVVDLIIERELVITALALNDIDRSTLTYLSADDHLYFDGNTRIFGTITIEGPEDATIDSVELEVLQGGGVVARGTLADEARGALLQTLGSDERVSIGNTQLLFELPSTQAALVNGDADGTVTLRVRAKAGDKEAEREFGDVEILVRYDQPNRYPAGSAPANRDGHRGGDDWVKPSVKEIIEHFADITVGDISNMNGGSFAPDHAGHRDGFELDGWFPAYNALNAVTATTIIGHLNDATYGSNITTVYVTFQPINTNAFWNAIKNVELDDGRRARDVIRPASGHDTHFHWIVAP
jgi:hypothetical protein